MPLPDLDSISTYNSAPNGTLADYEPVTDPTTDQPASGANAQQASTAMMTRTVTRAFVSFTVSGGVCTIVDHDAVWGNSVAVIPTVTYVSAGVYRIDWPATVTDAIGGSHSVNLRHGWANVQQGGTTAFYQYVLRETAIRFTVHTFSHGTGAADVTNGTLVEVFST